MRMSFPRRGLYPAFAMRELWVRRIKKQRLDRRLCVLDALLMSVADNIREKLNAAFAPTQLVVEDESAKHHGHAGARPEGETHFRVTIVSSAFTGLSRVERQRRIYATLADELRERVHALSLTAQSPEESHR
jgi:BolA family transcriptional regulator, general stress-responsive regulator